MSESGEPIRNSPAGIMASFIPIELVICMFVSLHLASPTNPSLMWRNRIRVIPVRKSSGRHGEPGRQPAAVGRDGLTLALANTA
jgi:hypothetical protein